MKKHLLTLLTCAACAFFPNHAIAAPIGLIDRGGGLIYDPILNITWLQNTNLANTTFNSWSSAVSWADSLVYQGYDDWRLPTSPATQQGWVSEGEMGHLYYVTLGNVAFSTSPAVGPFLNIVPGRGIFWMGATPLHAGSAWAFEFHTLASGFQNAWSETNTAFAWAVRNGDSSPIPEPATGLLVIAGGLASLAARCRSRNRARRSG